MLQDLKPEFVGYLIMKMRAFQESDELDTQAHDGFAPEKGDSGLLADERNHPHDDDDITTAIDGLSSDEQCELIALAWLGRGDYEAQDWSQALEEARGRRTKRTGAYLLGMTMLADYLEEGLTALNYNVEEIEYGR